MTGLTKIVENFDPISLEEMDGVRLLNRTDTKYLMNVEKFYSIVQELRENYLILEINGKRTNGYKNQYFDTPDFKFYRQHQNQKLNRTKVRIRKYLDSDISYFEVKFKSNKGRTIKERKRHQDFETILSEDCGAVLNRIIAMDPAILQPKLFNEFLRLTFVHREKKERLTIDFDLNFKNDSEEKSIDNLVIAELKQEKESGRSDFSRLMKKARVYPKGFSKYCMGSALLFPHLKANNFKPIFLLINKMTNGNH